MREFFGNFRLFQGELLVEERRLHTIKNHNILKLEKSVDEVLVGKRRGPQVRILVQNAERVVNEVPILQTSKITGVSGVGTQGIVFFLDNGHVLKFFLGGYHGGAKGEFFIYDEMAKMIFSGEGRSQDLIVYDYGTIEDLSYTVERTAKVELHYAEMPRLVKMDELFERSGRPFNVMELEEWLDKTRGRFRTGRRYPDIMQELYRGGSELNNLTKAARLSFEEAAGIIRAINRKIEINQPTNDMGLGNLGAYEHAPTRFVWFDI